MLQISVSSVSSLLPTANYLTIASKSESPLLSSLKRINNQVTTFNHQTVYLPEGQGAGNNPNALRYKRAFGDNPITANDILSQLAKEYAADAETCFFARDYIDNKKYLLTRDKSQRSWAYYLRYVLSDFCIYVYDVYQSNRPKTGATNDRSQYELTTTTTVTASSSAAPTTVTSTRIKPASAALTTATSTRTIPTSAAPTTVASTRTIPISTAPTTTVPIRLTLATVATTAEAPTPQAAILSKTTKYCDWMDVQGIKSGWYYCRNRPRD